MYLNHYIFVGLGIVVLSACGGSSLNVQTIETGGGLIDLAPIVPSTPGVPDYNSALGVANAGSRVTADIDALGLTSPSSFQRSGSAIFSGPLLLRDSSVVETATVAGGITIGIDFEDAAKVTAIAGNFYDLASTRARGTLTLSGVEFSEGTSGGGFVGKLTGTLRDVGPAGQDAIYDYDVDMAALYYGAGVEGVLAIVGGTATELGADLGASISGAAALERE